MANEEAIVEELKKQFPFMAETLRVQRARRVFATVAYDRFEEVLAYAAKQMQFSMLCTITGTDDGETLGALYHLGRPDGTLLNLKTSVPKAAPNLQTIRSYYPASVLYERELVDLLGFEVAGLPPGNRYPLQDNWPAGQHPLRKDWSMDMLDKVEAEKGE